MRISLIHKPDTGDGAHSKKELLRLLADAGHDVSYFRRDEDWHDPQALEADLVLVAGGDGTVSSVVRRLLGTDIPFATLPTGTANNISAQLGWTGKPAEVISLLNSGCRVPFSIGVARGPWGATHFLEGVGIGPFASAISFAKSHMKGLMPTPKGREKKLHRDLQLVRAFLMENSPSRCRIELDGEVVDDEFLLVEAMNTGRIGPNIQLAPDARVGDEVLDVITAGETDRLALAEYLERCIEEDCSPPSLSRLCARHIKITTEATRVHIDDVVWPKHGKPPPPTGASFEVDIQLDERPVMALVPTLAMIEQV